MNKLSLDVLENIRLLLDKPISPLTQRQIADLVAKQTVPASQILPLFTSKYRSDLILSLLHKENIPLATINFLLQHLRKDIHKYSQQDVEAIFGIVLKKQEVASLRGDWGLMHPLEEALKRTNEEAKDRLFWLIRANVEVLRELDNSKEIQTFMGLYIRYYLKHNIYLGSFAALSLLCLKLDEMLPKSQLLDRSTKQLLFQRTISLLQSASGKHAYSFQNYCLRVLTNIMRDSQHPIPDMIDMHNCSKTLQLYLWKKPTREDARNAQHAYELTMKKIKAIEEGKRHQSYPTSQLETKQQLKPVLLIQNVIDRVNMYRQHKQPDYSKIASVIKSNLDAQKSPSRKRNSPTRVAHKQYFELQKAIEDCLEQRQRQEEEQSLFKQAGNHDVEEASMERTVSSCVSSKVEEFEQFEEVSNLIDLAYAYRFS